MNITIFYFSGTGNTWWIADKLKRELDTKNSVKTYSIENELLSNRDEITNIINNSDHIVIGYPVYASKMPSIMEEFVESLPKLKSAIDLTIYCTQAIASGDGANYNIRRFKEKGFVIKQTEHFRMGNNFYLPHLPIAPTRNKKILNRLNAKSMNRLQKLALYINKQEKRVLNVTPPGLLLGVVQRKFYKETITHVQKSLEVDPTSCIKCNICIKNCPGSNISMVNGEITFNKKCIGCVRCYHFCPRNSILIGDKTKNSNKYYRYRGPVKDMKLETIRE